MDRMVVGCGYVGERIAKIWRDAGDEVFVTTRSTEKAMKFASWGLKALVWDWTAEEKPKILEVRHNEVRLTPFEIDKLNLSNLKTVLVAVSHAQRPSVSHSDQQTVLPNHHPIGLQNLWEFLGGKTLIAGSAPRTSPRWIYLSTTGVLNSSGRPDAKGDRRAISDRGNANSSSTANDSKVETNRKVPQWLDETSPVGPNRPGAKNAADGEAWILSNGQLVDRLVLRPTGIYGEDRVPNWRAIRDQTPLEVSPDSYLNLVHVEDLVAVIRHFAQTKPQYELYCVGDNQPVRRAEYYNCIAALGGFPAPVYDFKIPVGSSSDSAITASKSTRSNTDKRISSQRLHNEIPFSFHFPSYREGLQALIPACIESDATNQPLRRSQA